ncbi:MAG TPA: alpha-2-macroglobulin, partial [Flavisolibacter sp.]
MKPLKYLLIFFLLIFSIQSFAQMKQYDVQWKKVDDLMNKKKLPKSALAEVKKIYALAKKEGQQAQVIKSLVYMAGLQDQTREDNEILSIRDFEKEIAVQKEPAASILRSLLAGQYWNYLQQNRYRFYDRTNTAEFKKEDISTWTLDDLHEKISGLYLASISNEKLLQQTKLDPYNAIIIKGNLRHLRPTLFDLLAHRALDYFKNDERDISRPSYAFEIRQAEAFAPANQFAAFDFVTRDSSSLQHKALQVYQQLIAFHLNDARPDALVDADIARIEFVYQNAVNENKDSLYKQALENIIQKYPGNAIAKKANYLLAFWYQQKANDYEPLKDTTHRY